MKTSWKNKVISCCVKLEEKWDKIVAKQNIVNHLVASQKEAEIRTQEAIRSLNEVDNILIHTLSIDDTIDWETLKDKSKFREPNPEIELSKKLMPFCTQSTIYRKSPSKATRV